MGPGYKIGMKKLGRLTEKEELSIQIKSIVDKLFPDNSIRTDVRNKIVYTEVPLFTKQELGEAVLKNKKG